MELHISTSTPEDVPLLEKLINSAYRGEESKKGWTTEANLLEGKRIDADGIEKMMTGADAVILKCCNNDNDLVGCVYLKKNDNKMYLGMLTVSPTLQAAGIGKKILKAAEDHAEENSCGVVEMRVVSVRPELIAWYQRHGYHDNGQRSPFENGSLSRQLQPLEFLHMEKTLQ